MSHGMLPFDTLAATIVAHESKADQHYRSAGLRLIEARTRIEAGEDGAPVTFTHFIVNMCKMSRTRAYELIAIAEGRETPEGIRARAKASMAKTRAARQQECPKRFEHDAAEPG